MIECIRARDKRLADAGGKWFGNYETPVVLSKLGRLKLRRGDKVDGTIYGRKESEGKDFNEDTNFGKLARVPYEALQKFLAKHVVTPVEVGATAEIVPAAEVEEAVDAAAAADADIQSK